MTANEKKLYVLEQLREEWDLTPKRDKAEYKGSFSENYIVYYKDPGETTISYQKQLRWYADCDMDSYELKNILTIFQQEGIISNFEFLSEYR